LVLMDDGEHPLPTKANIEAGFDRLVRYSQPNDVVFISFSGHGGQVEDLDGDEDDGCTYFEKATMEHSVFLVT